MLTNFFYETDYQIYPFSTSVLFFKFDHYYVLGKGMLLINTS